MTMNYNCHNSFCNSHSCILTSWNGYNISGRDSACTSIGLYLSLYIYRNGYNFISVFSYFQEHSGQWGSKAFKGNYATAKRRFPSWKQERSQKFRKKSFQLFWGWTQLMAFWTLYLDPLTYQNICVGFVRSILKFPKH